MAEFEKGRKKLKSDLLRGIDKTVIEAVARRTGFCKRLRKLNPHHFLELLLFKNFDSSKETLTDHIYELQASRGISIKKQSLQTRFTPQAVDFVKGMAEELMSSSGFFVQSDFVKGFTKVFVQDATRFGLPDQFEQDYPGFKGGGGKAGAQIGFVYEMKENKIISLDLSAATKNENLSSKGNTWIEEGSLVLRDLGYFSFDGLLEVAEKKAFFISRAKPKTAFSENGRKLDLKELVSHMKKYNIQYLEKDLIMGHHRKIPVRVIFSLVPEQVEQERLRKANRNAKYRNWKVEEDYKVWASINAFITNIPEESIEKKKLPILYKLRWQIELVFKTWKSHYNIHLYKSVKKERMECYLYGTLLLILLHWKIFAWLQHIFREKKMLLSLVKFTKAILHFGELFKAVFKEEITRLDRLLDLLCVIAKDCLKKEQKKGKTSMHDIVYNTENEYV